MIGYSLIGAQLSVSIVSPVVIGYHCNCLDGQLNWQAFTHCTIGKGYQIVSCTIGNLWHGTKCFHNIFERLLVDLIYIFEEPACKKPNLWGAGNFIFWFFSPYSHGTFLHPQWQEEQPPGNFLQAVPEIQGGEQSIGTFLSA